MFTPHLIEPVFGSISPKSSLSKVLFPTRCFRRDRSGHHAESAKRSPESTSIAIPEAKAPRVQHLATRLIGLLCGPPWHQDSPAVRIHALPQREPFLVVPRFDSLSDPDLFLANLRSNSSSPDVLPPGPRPEAQKVRIIACQLRSLPRSISTIRVARRWRNARSCVINNTAPKTRDGSQPAYRLKSDGWSAHPAAAGQARASERASAARRRQPPQCSERLLRIQTPVNTWTCSVVPPPWASIWLCKS